MSSENFFCSQKDDLTSFHVRERLYPGGYKGDEEYDVWKEAFGGGGGGGALRLLWSQGKGKKPQVY